MAGDAGEEGTAEDPVSPENLRTNFLGMNLAAPECGAG